MSPVFDAKTSRGRFFMRATIAIVLSVTFTSCGNALTVPQAESSPDSSKTAEKKEYLEPMLVDTKDDLPECLDTTKGQLIYVENKNQFFYCSNKLSWVSIDLKSGNTESNVETESKADKLANGLTKNQVVSVLGEPDSIQKEGDWLLWWHYSGSKCSDGRTCLVDFDVGTGLVDSIDGIAIKYVDLNGF